LSKKKVDPKDLKRSVLHRGRKKHETRKQILCRIKKMKSGFLKRELRGPSVRPRKEAAAWRNREFQPTPHTQ